jgi:hypothetical protein
VKLKLGRHTLELQPGSPLVMGIVNIDGCGARGDAHEGGAEDGELSRV